MLPRYTSPWALTPNCEQMCLAGLCRDHSCLAASKHPFWGPRRSLEHLDPAEEHLTLGLLAGGCSPGCTAAQHVGETRPPSCLSGPLKWWGAAGQAMEEAVLSGPDLVVTWLLAPLWPFTIPA